MVKAELTIRYIKKDELEVGFDLLKREDWNEQEFEIAKSLQNSLMAIIEIMKSSGFAKEVQTEIIE